ncbi:MAG: hypothetical protein QM743_03425 [Chitinophagaceae bacterium]
MAHTILIPTDFTPASLALVRSALNSDHEPLHILLVHGIAIRESITGMLFFSKANVLMKLMNAEFRQAMEDLKTVYGRQTGFCESGIVSRRHAAIFFRFPRNT